MITEDKRIIGLCGRASSGKTMLANYLTEKHGYKRVYVAQALKELCAKIYGLTIDELNQLKNVQKDFKLNETHAKLISDTTNIDYENVCKELEKINYTLTSTRHAFQFVGTDLIRNYNPNWHIETMLSTMNSTDKYVVDDVRFPNEVQALQYTGSMLIFVIRPSLENVSHHKSEESIRWDDFNNLIINNSSKEQAIIQLDSLLLTQDNAYANEYLDKYHPHWGLDKSSNKIEIESENPAVINLIDRTVGWIIATYDGNNNPLEIEDFKFKMQPY